jgi:hypothetical protein
MVIGIANTVGTIGSVAKIRRPTDARHITNTITGITIATANRVGMSGTIGIVRSGFASHGPTALSFGHTKGEFHE